MSVRVRVRVRVRGILGLRVRCERAAKRCSYASGSVGAFIQIPKAMHKRVDTRGGLDSGSRTKSKR